MSSSHLEDILLISAGPSWPVWPLTHNNIWLTWADQFGVAEAKVKGVHQILLLGIDLLLSSAVRISSSPFSSHSSLTFCFSDHLLTIVLDQISKQPNVI